MFRALPPQLHGTAEEVVRFFKDDRGISKFKIEEAADNTLDYRPTLQARTPEHYDVWIEVTQMPYLSSLDRVVLHCMKECLPVKLYVAFPTGVPTGDYKRHIDEARENGVGALEAANGKIRVIHEALSLSLSGVRRVDRSQFPPRYRLVLSSAESTFRNGDPAKGCSLVYDEIEHLSRRLAKKIQSNAWWTNKSTPPTKFRPQKDNWAPLMEMLIQRTDLNSTPGLDKNMLHRVMALTSHRNDSGHKPSDRASRIRRDRELRTRFESAVDILRDFVGSTKSLRL